MSETKSKRPKVLAGIDIKVITGCGNMYVKLNWNNDKLFEIFATLGKAGGCATCQSEAITRCLTIGLGYGVPIEVFVKHLSGISCPYPVAFPKKDAVSSCPDAIAKILKEYGLLSLRQALDKAEGTTTDLTESEVADRVQQLASEREKAGLYE